MSRESPENIILFCDLVGSTDRMERLSGFIEKALSVRGVPIEFPAAVEQAIAEIGWSGMAELLSLQRHLQGSNDEPLRFRYAPSIVARCESELLGTSVPRFAIRAYLDRDGLSFVNARRLRLLAPNVALSSSSDRTSCVGDSLLQPPASLLGRFHILTAQLGRVYGEGMNVRGTPFVRQSPDAGGALCAQSVCFMAMALLHDELLLREETASRFVCAPAEVAIAAGSSADGSIVTDVMTRQALRGISIRRLARRWVGTRTPGAAVVVARVRRVRTVCD